MIFQQWAQRLFHRSPVAVPCEDCDGEERVRRARMQAAAWAQHETRVDAAILEAEIRALQQSDAERGPR